MQDEARGQLMADRLGMNYVPSEYLRDCRKHATFFRFNYLRHLPTDKQSRSVGLFSCVFARRPSRGRGGIRLVSEANARIPPGIPLKPLQYAELQFDGYAIL